MEVLREEYMSSIVKRFNNRIDCELWVHELVRDIMLECQVIRVKIECPYYLKYKDIACYIESHTETTEALLPISRNKKSGKLMNTDRCYDKSLFPDFNVKYQGNADVELCIYDSFIKEDEDWFKLM